MKDTIAAWEAAAQRDDARQAIHPSGSSPADYRATGQEAAEAIARILGPDVDLPPGAILDFGCGDGRVTVPLAAHYPTRVTIGADSSDGMLRRLRAREHPDIETVRWDGLPGPGAPRGLAVIFALAVLIHHHHRDAARIIEGLTSALQPGGLLILDLSLYEIGNEPESWTGVSTWTLRELEAVAHRSGLDIERATVSRGRFSYHTLGEHHGDLLVLRRRAPREQLRVLAIVHMYPPEHNAGAEWMLHSILRSFVERGDVATVVYRGCPAPYVLDGVSVSALDKPALPALAHDHDVVITHLDVTDVAVAAADLAARPTVHLLHNDQQLRHWRIRPSPTTLAVYNSEWLTAKDRHWRGERIVCRPHVRVADYATEPGALVTLINLARMKGGRTFAAIAAAMPERRFLGVRGAWGVQDATATKNVDVVGQTTDIRRDVYARTRVLLMPSMYESWGRTAVEAACSGIPTIAAPTPGLREALGPAGIFCDPGRTGDWVAAIRCLDDPEAYACHSAEVRARALELEEETTGDLAALRDRLVALVQP